MIVKVNRTCDFSYICDKYGLNRISLACSIKIDIDRCPKYVKDKGVIRARSEVNEIDDSI